MSQVYRISSILRYSFFISLALGVVACAQVNGEADPDVAPPTLNKVERFQVPNPTPAEVTAILDKYQYVDPTHTIADSLLRSALVYYDVNKAHIGNTSVLSVVDFSQYSGRKRLFMIDMQTGAVVATYVAHGLNSDPSWSGYATKFSNVIGSEESSVGFYLTEETYSGKHGYSMRLDGLSSTNSNVRARAVVVHEANYVYDKAVKQGRSDGCFALPNDQRDYVIGRLRGSSLIYAGLSSSPTSF
jgi:hypothetical protein